MQGVNAGTQGTVSALIARLDGVREARVSPEDARCGIVRRWMARCPAHDDRTPSLSIALTADGRALLHCFAGCDAEHVLASVGLSWRDLAPGAGGDGAAESAAPPLLIQQTDYEIRDEQGRLVAVHRRKDFSDGSKRFTWLRPGPDGKLQPGLNGLSPAVLPLYGVDQLDVRVPGVVICEGEKCVEALHQIVRNAVGTVCGAHLCPSDDVLRPLLRFSRVYLWPDSDPPGRQHMLRVGQALVRLGARDVRVIDWPDAPPGGDAADFVEQHGDQALRELEKLFAVAVPWDVWAREVQAQMAAEARAEALGAEPEDEAEAAPAWTPFPTHLLPKPVADYVRAAAAAIPCEEAMLALPALAVLSAAVGSGARVRLKRSWIEPGTLWTVVVAPSGSSKSAAMELALRPIFHLEQEAAEAYERDRSLYEQELAAWQALTKEDRANRPAPEPPRMQRFRVADATLEAVAAVHADNPHGLLLARDELSGWISSFDRYAQTRGGDLHGWMEMYEGRPVVVDRKTAQGPLRIERPHVPVARTIQPWILQARVSPELLASGFVARLMLAMPPEKPRRFTDADVEEATTAAYERLIRRLYTIADVELALSSRARSLFAEFVEELDTERRRLPDGPIWAALSKMEARTARFALIFQLCEDTTTGGAFVEISANAMQRAIELARWCWHETQRVYALMGWSRVSYATLYKTPAERVLEKMPAEFTVEDWTREALKDGAGTDRTARRWLARLVQTGRVARLQRGRYRKDTCP